jgi:uncharacterized membrane protein YdjX (TVP38/TMEM64 family)
MSMRFPAKRVFFLSILFTLAGVVWFSGVMNALTFENLKSNQVYLRQVVEEHYLLSLFVYLAVFVLTTCAIPGTLLVIIAGGALFDTFPGVLYATGGAALGGVVAFTLSRYLLGDWLQARYKEQLVAFNREVSKNGQFYLITVRLVPVLPFFLVSYLAGLTKIRLRTFTWATAAGVFPACLAYSFIGSQIGEIRSSQDLASPKIFMVLIFLAFLCLFPVVWKKIRYPQ